MASIQHVLPTPIPGLYEIDVGGRVLYVDKGAEYIIDGRLIDIRNGKRDLTQERWEIINRVDFDTLPTEHAITRRKGNGERKLAVFADPNCGYCKKLERESLSHLTNVTIYTFLLSGLGADSEEKARAIWCADDPAAAWESLMIKTEESRGAPPECDDRALGQIKALGAKLNVRGTPTVFFESGLRVHGAVPLKRLEEGLSP